MGKRRDKVALCEKLDVRELFIIQRQYEEQSCRRKRNKSYTFIEEKYYKPQGRR